MFRMQNFSKVLIFILGLKTKGFFEKCAFFLRLFPFINPIGSNRPRISRIFFPSQKKSLLGCFRDRFESPESYPHWLAEVYDS